MACRIDPPVPERASASRLTTVLLVLIAVILTVWFLRATAAVMVPLTASVLIALAVMPVRDWVRRKLPDRLGWLGIVAAMAVILAAIAVFFGALWLAAQQVVAQFPDNGGDPVDLMPQPGMSGDAAAQAGAAPDMTGAEGEPGGLVGALMPDSLASAAERFSDTIIGLLSSVSTAILDSAVGLVSALVIIFFLTLLMLIESGDWRRKAATIMARRNEWRLTESAEVIAQKLRAWLLIRASLGLVTALLYGAWLWVFDVGLLLVWAVLTFLLNFIPTIGSIIAGLLPTLYALVTHDFGTASWVGLGILVIEQVMGNFVDPKVSGDRIAVSPLVVLVALMVWSWIWGIPGALLAGPVTVSLIVIGAHVPIMRPWALLLSDRTDMEGLAESTRPE